MEARAAELLSDERFHPVTAIRRRAIAQCGLQAVANRYVVIPIDAEDIFDHVHVAADVDAIDGHTQREALRRLMGDRYF